MISNADRIRMLCRVSRDENGKRMTACALASKMGLSRQGLNYKFFNNSFTQQEMEAVARICGCEYVSAFKLPNGESL